MTYAEGKAFLQDAVLVHFFTTSTRAIRSWRKPDGSLWSENESKLEAPEDDYSVRMICDREASPCQN